MPFCFVKKDYMGKRKVTDWFSFLRAASSKTVIHHHSFSQTEQGPELKEPSLWLETQKQVPDKEKVLMSW